MINSILLYLAIVDKGDWTAIYKDVLRKRYVNETQRNEAEELLKKSNGIKYITLLDSDYPECLKYIFKPPFVLFYKGNIELLKSNNKKIAIIGSRNCSSHGKEVTRRITKELVENNIIIISGLAKGIDSEAHKTCIENGGKTIAVLGNGVDVFYPKENEQLYKDIIDKGGLIISEYPPNSTPNGEHFPVRNRIIAGLSDGVAVIEARRKSGTMNTVSHALENDKPVFCVPGSYSTSSGCNYLIKEGASLIENAQDILVDI